MNFRVGHQLRKRGKVALGMVDTSEKELTEGKMPCTADLDWIGLDWFKLLAWVAITRDYNFRGRDSPNRG